MPADHDSTNSARDHFRLDGKTALVTGASRGIGAAIALAMAEAGADLALVARSSDDLEALAGKLRVYGVRAEAIVCDVTDSDQVTAAVDGAIASLGQVDILVNNAGGPVFNSSFLDMRESGWHKVMELNLTSVVRFCQAVGEHMTARQSGSVINITSPAALRPWPAITAYGAAKAAVLNLTQALAQEWAREQVRVNAISPGWIRTEINRVFSENDAASASIAANVPLGRWGDPTDVAAGVVWLASDAARYVTGAHIAIDGGLTVAVPEDWRELRAERTWRIPSVTPPPD